MTLIPKRRQVCCTALLFMSFCCLVCLASSLAQQIPDPANLTGEHVAPPALADTLPINHGAPALQQLLAKLRTRASLMLIVAHPDDEDGGLLTYESRGQGARVAMLTLTRGEGGQNLMSGDFGDALGLIRTQELLAADRYMGVDQFFGTEVDFGFSKTKEETLEKWTHERVLYDAVRAVRLYRPLVVASVFVGGPTDGHGHHQTAGEIAQEVFLAAADPKVFPEMIAQGLLPWAPLKVYARVPFSRVTAEGMYDYATGKTIPTRFHNYATGADTTSVPTATVLIHEGDKPADATLLAAMGGETYVQFARRGLALQKSQIGANARLAPAGAFDAPYTLMASRLNCAPKQAVCPLFAFEQLQGSAKLPASEQSLFQGIDTSLTGLADLAPGRPEVRQALTAIDTRVAEAQKLFDPAHLDLAAPPLRAALSSLDILVAVAEKSGSDPTQRLNLLHELRIKRVELNNALLLALGLSFQPRLAPAAPIPGDASHLVANESLRIAPNLGGDHAVQFGLTSIGLDAAPGLLSSAPVSATNLMLSQTVAALPPPTRPYFFRHNLEQPFYDLTDPNLRNAPATPAPLVEEVHITYQGVPLEMRAIVQAPVPASAAQSPAQLSAVPAISIQLVPSVGIVPLVSASTDRIALTGIVRATVPNAAGTLRLQLPPAWKAEGAMAAGAPSGDPDLKRVNFTAIPSGRLTPNQPYNIAAVANYAGHDFNESFRPVGYPGLPATNLYTPAVFRATVVDVATATGLRVAYLPGTGDSVPDFLPNLGITPTVIAPGDLTASRLKEFDAVLLGVRAYAAQAGLAGAGSKPLLEYAKSGGTVILQYNTTRYGNAEAPFPIDVPGDSAHNVVVEADPVTLLQPAAPLLTWPNQMTSADFDNWVEERGHGFAASWSPSYIPLLETHDPGQDPQRGSLLLAPVGKGAYIYCALALYRQLPEGVPGAYRLLANLLSYGKNPHR